ncbi:MULTISPECIES: hypothetical protein [Streptomyces]|uniref:hypothetical protein n=2 Tax=Streptomyces TaxID=1883 RepID=UPI001EF22F6C|nr:MULTISPECIES: hypothetical protein [Streptomyces]WSZ52590.1 hypothetical protein OG337_27210 [[Kitasatospora] papulosa]
MCHTCVSWLVQKGVSLYELQHLLGHESFQTTCSRTRTRPSSGPGSGWKPRSRSPHQRSFAPVLLGQERSRLRAEHGHDHGCEFESGGSSWGEHPAAVRVERPQTGVGIDVVFMLCIRSRNALLKRGSERPGRAGEQGSKATLVSRGVIYARAQLV